MNIAFHYYTIQDFPSHRELPKKRSISVNFPSSPRKMQTLISRWCCFLYESLGDDGLGLRRAR